MPQHRRSHTRYTLAISSKKTGYVSQGWNTYNTKAAARKAATSYNKYYGYQGYHARPIPLKKVPKNKIWKE
jgi:hypothetical protein